MRRCLLTTWLCAGLLLSLQRGCLGSAPSPPDTPRLARTLLMQPDSAGAGGGARYARNRGQARQQGGVVLLDELETAVDEDKRQFDDYGHMRFGKRGPQVPSEDYGHMRFGKRGPQAPSEDYGHMRFGKRGPQAAAAFDDYGHMRFGRAGGAD